MEKYRTTMQRFLAGFVDGLVFTPLVFLDIWVIEANPPAPVYIAWMLFFYPAGWLYNVLMHGVYGQTLGKMALGVRVLDISESPISMRQAFLRDSIYIVFNVVSLITSIFLVLSSGSRDSKSLQMIGTIDSIVAIASLIWFVAEIISCLTNQKRRAIHDFIAGTVVIKMEYIPVEKDEVNKSIEPTLR